MTGAFDVLIRNGRIIDGTGNPWFHGDVALSGDRIAAIEPPGRIPDERARQVVDASGMVVCPGFIDIQSHSIVSLMRDGRSLSKVTQGVTTEIMGEAWTPAPFGGRIEDPFALTPVRIELQGWAERAREWRRFGDWLGAMIERGVSPNIGSFLGGGTLRMYAKGMDMGPSTPEELGTMRRVMEEAMVDGAFGVSYALIYPPDGYAETDEIVEVCTVVGRHGGLYITHMRSEGGKLIEALEESLEIGRRARLPVEIYHLKASGKSNWHKMPRVIARISAARAAGIDVTADMYPYVASGTGLSAIFPAWLAEGGKFFENLRDPAVRARVRDIMLRPGSDQAGLGGNDPDEIMPIGFDRPEHQGYVGKRLSRIAAMRNQDWVDAAIDLLIAEEQRIGTVFFKMSEENLALQLRQPWIKVSTDAAGVDPAWAAQLGPVHPRTYGTYPRVLGAYVRDRHVIKLEDAVRKMTGAVAARLGLRERGLLRAGMYADVVIFDPETIGDRATFEDSHQPSTGIRDVWVNGARVLAGGAHTGATPGRIVSGAGRS